MDFNKKEMPIQGFAGFGGGATGASFRSAADEAKYVDEVYSTYVWTGTGSSNSITNNINLSSKGGMVWVKNRDQNDNNWLFSNAMGLGNGMRTNTDADKFGLGSNGMSSFNDDGFTVGGSDGVNGSGEDIVSWTFRNSKAFQTLTYEGTGSAQNISHSLGSIPGMIWLKNIDASSTNWSVYHRDFMSTTGTPAKYIIVNSTSGAQTSGVADYWNSTAPTATQFTVGSDNDVNKDGDTYIAYVFGGGESTAATAVSVDFDGTTDELEVSDSADFDYGSGDFTLELWINPNINDHSSKLIHAHTSGSNEGPCNLYFDNSGTNMLTLYSSSNGGSFDVSSGTEFGIIPAKSWTHIAVAREGNNIRMFRNGINVATISHSGSMMNPTGTFDIGGRLGGNFFNGKISNFRVVKGTAVYTTSFTVPTEPLTNITNTVLLCCNNASTTGSTVVPSGSSITANGDPTADTQSPFDDPANFAFGEDEDTNIVKMGSYTGTGTVNSGVGPDIYLGWEPQFVMIKRTDTAEIWMIFDSIRGIVSGGNDAQLRPGSSALEYSYDRLEVSPTGFRPKSNNNYTNADGGEYIYMAFRRSDALVGKPAEAGTEAFAIDLDGTNSGNPSWVSGFPVDFQFIKDRNGTTYDWYSSSRLTQGRYISLMSNSTETSNANYKFDYNTGWSNYSSANGITSWMWKRGKGFTNIVYRGGGTAGQVVMHDLNAVPKMIWVKRLTGSNEGWSVYHVGLNGGTNPSHWNLKLDETAVQEDTESRWYDTAPTSRCFQIGDSSRVNGSDDLFQAMLWADVTDISKCGYYTGTGSNQTITTVGFQPRFLVIKSTDQAEDWLVIDSVRGVNYTLAFNSQSTQSNSSIVTFASNGFNLIGGAYSYNGNNAKYVYYAHA